MVFPRPEEVELRDIPRATVRRGHVLVETRFTSISAGTELLVLEGRLPGVYRGVMRYPLVPGYENVGQVVDVGSGVTGLEPGEWVCCEGSASFRGLHSCWGGHAETLVVGAGDALRLPPSLAPEHGVFMVLTSIALHGLQRAQIALGDEVAILGQGVVGVLAAQVAKAMGAVRVVAIDRLPNRLRAARDLGVDETILVGDDGPQAVAEACERAVALTAGRGFDAVVEVTGSSEVVAAAPSLCRERGRLLLLGMYPNAIAFDYWELYSRELDVIASRQAGPKEELPDPYYRWTWRRTHEQSLELLARGAVSVDRLISRRLPVERIAEGYEALRREPNETIKVLLEWA